MRRPWQASRCVILIRRGHCRRNSKANEHCDQTVHLYRRNCLVLINPIRAMSLLVPTPILQSHKSMPSEWSWPVVVPIRRRTIRPHCIDSLWLIGTDNNSLSVSSKSTLGTSYVLSCKIISRLERTISQDQTQNNTAALRVVFRLDGDKCLEFLNHSFSSPRW